MEDRNNPGNMLGEPSPMQAVMYESYKDDPYFRLLVELRPLAEQFIYDNSYDGVTAPELAIGIKCTDDVANGLIINLLAVGLIYYCGDAYKKDGVEMYRHNNWVDDSESYCVVCGSPSHSNCDGLI